MKNILCKDKKYYIVKDDKVISEGYARLIPYDVDFNGSIFVASLSQELKQLIVLDENGNILPIEIVGFKEYPTKFEIASLDGSDVLKIGKVNEDIVDKMYSYEGENLVYKYLSEYGGKILKLVPFLIWHFGDNYIKIINALSDYIQNHGGNYKELVHWIDYMVKKVSFNLQSGISKEIDISSMKIKGFLLKIKILHKIKSLINKINDRVAKNHFIHTSSTDVLHVEHSQHINIEIDCVKLKQLLVNKQDFKRFLTENKIEERDLLKALKSEELHSNIIKNFYLFNSSSSLQDESNIDTALNEISDFYFTGNDILSQMLFYHDTKLDEQANENSKIGSEIAKYLQEFAYITTKSENKPSIIFINGNDNQLLKNIFDFKTLSQILSSTHYMANVEDDMAIFNKPSYLYINKKETNVEDYLAKLTEYRDNNYKHELYILINGVHDLNIIKLLEFMTKAPSRNIHYIVFEDDIDGLQNKDIFLWHFNTLQVYSKNYIHYIKINKLNIEFKINLS